MKITILIPHFSTAKMTTYSVAQFLKYKGDHEVRIIISDNNPGDGSIEYLKPFGSQIEVIDHPKDIMHSHGTSLDRLVPMVDSEYFITAETDSFPTQNGWLDYYEDRIGKGYDMAGSKLRLSGGEYIHPCGCLYRKSLWEEAKKYCDGIEYTYFPNMSLKDNFACHTMVHKRILDQFLDTPEDYVELGPSYNPYSRGLADGKAKDYSPVVGPFHNGMGMRQESVLTYGNRTIETDSPLILLDNKIPIIKRVGYEPGQWLTYFAHATGKKAFDIPTMTKWLDGKENQQQEYTQMANGFRHLWGITSYHGYDGGDPEITRIKRTTPEELYNSLPINQRI